VLFANTALQCGYTKSLTRKYRKALLYITVCKGGKLHIDRHLYQRMGGMKLWFLLVFRHGTNQWQYSISRCFHI